jgi:hypothetical protein
MHLLVFHSPYENAWSKMQDHTFEYFHFKCFSLFYAHSASADVFFYALSWWQSHMAYSQITEHMLPIAAVLSSILHIITVVPAVSAGNMFQDLLRLLETADSTECYM